MSHGVNRRSRGGYRKLGQIGPVRDEDFCLLILDITIPRYIVNKKVQNSYRYRGLTVQHGASFREEESDVTVLLVGRLALQLWQNWTDLVDSQNEPRQICRTPCCHLPVLPLWVVQIPGAKGRINRNVSKAKREQDDIALGGSPRTRQVPANKKS